MSDIDRRDARAPAAGAAAGAFRPLPDFASSTSRATTRPCGPEPVMRREVDAGFLGEAPGQRRGEGAVVAVALCRRCRSLRRGSGAAAQRRFRSGGCGSAGAGAAAAFGAGACGARPSAARCRAGARRLHVLAVAGQHRDHVVDRRHPRCPRAPGSWRSCPRRRPRLPSSPCRSRSRRSRRRT